MWGGNPTKELIIRQRDIVVKALNQKNRHYYDFIAYKNSTKDQQEEDNRLRNLYNTELIKLHEMVNKYVDTHRAEYNKNAKKHKEDLKTFMHGTY